MNVLITGGAGFIGSHLTRLCLERGDKVSVLDDLSTGCIDNIKEIEDHPQFTFYHGSCLVEDDVVEAMHGVDHVYHLAAGVGVRMANKNPIHIIRTNVLGCEIVLRIAVKNATKIFIASSSEVYGAATTFPMREDAVLALGPTLKPRGAYGCSKAMDEWLALAYQQELDLPVVIGRFFNTSGSRQSSSYGMVIPNFVQNALKSKPLTVFDSGKQTRCFSHVTDVTQAMVKLMDEPTCEGRIFNIGSDHEVTINTLADKVISLTDSSSVVEWLPYAKAYSKQFEDHQRRVPDVSAIKNAINWQAKISLDEIIMDVVRTERDGTFIAKKETILMDGL